MPVNGLKMGKIEMPRNRFLAQFVASPRHESGFGLFQLAFIGDVQPAPENARFRIKLNDPRQSRGLIG